MTFAVSSFKSRVRDWMRPYTYNVIVEPPVGGGREIELRTEEVTLPGTSFASFDNYKPYGSGLALTIPHTPTIQEINCVHSIDAGGDILQKFYDWADSVVNLDGQEKFSANYLSEYTRNMTINIYDLQNNRVRRYDLNDAFPLSYDQIQLGWDATSELVKLSVNYRFRNYTVSKLGFRNFIET